MLVTPRNQNVGPLARRWQSLGLIGPVSPSAETMIPDRALLLVTPIDLRVLLIVIVELIQQQDPLPLLVPC